jgi:HlyD family secretion protein
MNKWLKRGLILAALVAVVALLRFTVLAPQPVQVETTAVERGTVEATVTNSKAGTVKTRRRARLSPEIGGRVVALPHREGARVRAGDVLLRLDDAAQRAQLTKARRDLAAAEAEHRRACLDAELAAREYRRNQALAADEIIPESLRDQSESAADSAAAACEAAAAQVESAEAAVGVLETQLAMTVLKAPFDGVVAEVSIEVGEWTTPSPPAVPVPPVIEMLDAESIYVTAPMDEVDSAKIHTGQPARVTLDPYPDRSFDGTVTLVDPYVLDVEAQNRTVGIEVELADADFAAALLPGTSADVEVILEVHEDVLRLPTSALLQGGEVMVLEDGVLARRGVETGLRNWDWTEITGGLAAGDRVVTSLDRAEVQAGAEAVDAGAGERGEAAAGTATAAP